VFGIIYKATGPDGRVYIGQTKKTLARRKAHHKCRALKGDRRTAFQAALLAEGFSSFTWFEIDTADNAAELDAKERHYVALYKSDDPAFGYNGTPGGTGYALSAEIRKKISEAKKGKPNGWEGKHLSTEHRLKIGKAHKGRIISGDQRRKQSASMKGRKLTQEHRKAISEGLKGNKNMVGKHPTTEARQKMSLAQKGHVVTEETRRKIGEAAKRREARNRARVDPGHLREKG
jgi:hypothetical protein